MSFANIWVKQLMFACVYRNITCVYRNITGGRPLIIDSVPWDGVKSNHRDTRLVFRGFYGLCLWWVMLKPSITVH
jgi:hypothetical protein